MVCLITLLVMNVVWYLQHEDTTSPCVHTFIIVVHSAVDTRSDCATCVLCSAYDIIQRI